MSRARLRGVLRDRLNDEPTGCPPGAGPVWTGGFAFDADGGAAPHWSSLPPALLVMPELRSRAAAGATFLTLTAIAGAGMDPGAVASGSRARLASLPTSRCRCSTHPPDGRVKSPAPPTRRHYEDAVAAAVERIRAGELDEGRAGARGARRGAAGA